MGAGSRGDFLDCPALDETLELGGLQHDAMAADALHGGKVSKDALNGFPFNSAAGGQSMLNSYGVGGADLDSKLRSDVLVGEQGSSEETGLMAPSVELDQLQAPWDSTDHTSPAHHMFNESDPILGPSALEPGFLEEEDEEAQGGDRGGEEGGTLEECLGLPPSSSPSHPSAGDPGEPLTSSYMLFKDIGVNEEPSADQTDLSASPPLPFDSAPSLSLADITAHEPQDGLGHSDISESLTNPGEDGEERERGGAGFQFDDKEEEEEEEEEQQEDELSRETTEQNGERDGGEDGTPPEDHSLALDPSMEAPEVDQLEPEPEPKESPELQEHFHKDDSHQDLDPFLGKLEADGSFECPESIEEPAEEEEEEEEEEEQEEDRLILYQTVEEQTMGGSLDSDVLMSNAAEEFVQIKEISDQTEVDPAEQVDEVSEGRDHHVSMVTAPPEEEEEQKPGDAEDMRLESVYPGYQQTSCSSVSVSSPAGASNPEAAAEQEPYRGSDGDLNPTGDCKIRPPDGNETNVSSNSIDTKPSDLKFPFSLDPPVKVEDVCPDGAEVKHSNFLSFAVKSEDLVTKAEQLEYPVKPEDLEAKPEDLSLPVKPESLDVKPDALHFVAYADVKPDVKPLDLGFAAYPDGAKLKTETKTEVAGFYPDSSETKPEAKPEVLELSGVKAEAKQETPEADSTVLTPKLEQADGLGDAPESMAAKGPVKEERPTTPVAPVVEGYAGSPRFATPMSMCEIPDSVHEAREPTIAQLLQEKALYSFSEWPKDRVIINRLDSICHAILKGKWPSSSEQYDSPGSLATNSCLAASLAQQHRGGFLPAAATAPGSGSGPGRVQQAGPGLGFSIPPPPLTRLPKYVPRGGACGRGAWRLTSLPLLQERLVAPPFLPELKRAGGRRSFDYEAAAAAAAKVLAGKSSAAAAAAACSSSSGGEKVPVVAPPSHRSGALLINGWQDAAIDLTKSSGEISTAAGAGTNEAAAAAAGVGGHKLPPPPPITAPLPGSVGIDMAGILQAGLIHPVTGQIVNGSLRGDDSLRRRRGRRRNVEALYSEFTKSRGLHLPDTQGRVEVISHSSVSSSTSSPSPSPSERPAGPPTPSSSSSTPTPTQTPPQPEIVAVDREAASKGLMEWLRQNPGYSMELPAFAHAGAGLLHGFVERPKQRRHRCKDPTKLDINSLTGEERVPVVHRGTGRRLGGAMAPAIKELSRWLDANSEYFVAPDWADVVKHSGFLPEGKFSRILTEPVNRDPASRRRGRRPRSEMPKPLLSVSDSSSPLGPPLFMNGGLIGSMDSMVAMQNLRGALPGIPISGIMAAGFPHGFSAAAGGAAAEDAKNGLSMLPMMLHGIPHPHGAAIPQHALFSVGTMMAPPPPHPAATSSSSSTSSSSLAAAKVTTTTAPSTSEASSPSSTTPSAEGSTAAAAGEKEKGGAEASKRAEAAAAAAIITSSSRAHLGAGSHLTFNPFLIPGMSHGLLYPHMFLPHGGIMALPAMPPGAVDGSPASPKRRRKRGKEEEQQQQQQREEEKEREKEEHESTVQPTSSSPPPPPPELLRPETQEPDSAAAAEEEKEEEERGEGEEQRQEGGEEEV